MQDIDLNLLPEEGRKKMAKMFEELMKKENGKTNDHPQIGTLSQTTSNAQGVSNATENDALRKDHKKSQEKISNSPSKNSSRRELSHQQQNTKSGNLNPDCEGESEKVPAVEFKDNEDNKLNEKNHDVLNMKPNQIDDFSQILKNPDISDSEKEKGSKHPQSLFVLNKMCDLYRLSSEKDRFVCIKCYRGGKDRKGDAKKNKHWYPVRSLLRHMLKAHVFEFKKNEKEFLKHIGFFREIENNANYDKIISQFKFNYDKLRDLSRVYCSVKDNNFKEKNRILTKLNSQLKDLLNNEKYAKDSGVKSAMPINESLTSNSKFLSGIPLQHPRDVKRTRKQPAITKREAEKENFEILERETSELEDDTFDSKTAKSVSSNKRAGADISTEDMGPQTKDSVLNTLIEQLKETKKQKEKNRCLKAENQKLREQLENYRQRCEKFN